MNRLILITALIMTASACQQNHTATITGGQLKQRYERLIPVGGNIFAHPSSRELEIAPAGLRSWSAPDQTAVIYVYSGEPLLADLSLLTSSHQTDARYRVVVNQTALSLKAPAHSTQLSLGSHQLLKGYNSIQLQGLATTTSFPEVRSLKVASDHPPQLRYVKDNDKQRFYWGRRGASVHLRYPLPSSQVKWMYSELEVMVGADPVGTFAMANGFKEGYFGLQVNSAEQRRVLFSVWSPYMTQDPDDIPDDLRVQLLKAGEGVQVQDFGQEGAGAQSYLVYPWRAGVRYQLLNSIEPNGDGQTTYAAYFRDPEVGHWRLIARLLRPSTSTWYQRPHSFLENFNPALGHLERSARYQRLWMRDVNLTWHPLTQASLTSDEIGSLGYRQDLQGGLESGAFFLRHCGFFNGGIEAAPLSLGRGQGSPPVIDFEELLSL